MALVDLEQSFRMRSGGLDHFGPVIAYGTHRGIYREVREGADRRRTNELVANVDALIVSAEPRSDVERVENDRHTVVHTVNVVTGLGSEYRAGLA